jgi:hypothetical protein
MTSPSASHSAIGLRPIGLKEANAAVARWHKHHGPVVQHRWSIGAFVDGNLCGVGIVERPKACGLATDHTIEVTRLAIDGTPHAASRILGHIRRDALSCGFRRLVSYTRIDEAGTCYRASGWWPTAIVKGREWAGVNKPNRWLPGVYVASSEIIDRVRWECGPDAAPELELLRHLGRRRRA